jgi:pyruvate dehydrogenase E1 component beta subunit
VSAVADQPATGAERMTYREALRLALREELARDERVFIMGEEVGVFEGSYKVTAGLMAEFGEDRVRDTPISEEGFVGAGVGAAMLGERPIVEIMTLNFLLVAMDQVINHAAKIGAMFGGEVRCPLVIRTPNGAGNQLTAQHSQSFDGWFAGTPGLKVVTPASPADAKGLLKAAIRDEDPVLVIENLPIYKEKGDVPLDPEFLTPIGRANVAREGSDITIVSHSFATVRALHVAEKLSSEKGVSAEVVDLRSLRPLDMETVVWRDAGAGGADLEGLLRRPRRAGRAGRDGRGPAAVREEPRDGGDAERGPDRGGGAERPGLSRAQQDDQGFKRGRRRCRRLPRTRARPRARACSRPARPRSPAGPALRRAGSGRVAATSTLVSGASRS